MSERSATFRDHRDWLIAGPDGNPVSAGYNWDANLFALDPKAEYADFYEKALYNHILGSIDPDSGLTTYFYSLKPGHFKVYCTPLNSFWCCTGTGVENHAKYGDSIYAHKGDTLWVNLFIPSELKKKWPALLFSMQVKTPPASSMRVVAFVTATVP